MTSAKFLLVTCHASRGTFRPMETEFQVRSPLDQKTYHCRFHTLTTGISLRHSDTVDVKFLMNGSPVVVALPHAAFAEYRRTTGRALTDPDAVRIAELALKRLLERGEPLDMPLLTLSREQTLELAEQVTESGQSRRSR